MQKSKKSLNKNVYKKKIKNKKERKKKVSFLFKSLRKKFPLVLQIDKIILWPDLSSAPR